MWATSVSAPIVEEIAKACVLLAVYLWRRHELNGVLDGLVYAGMVALGCATMENVLYYARAAAGGELGTVFVVRGVLSPFAHPIFTGMTGIGFALAVRARHRATRIVAPVLDLLLAISLHSLWNTSATLAGGLGLLLVYPLIFLPILVALIVTAALVRRRELRMIGRHLQHDVETGLLPAHELAVLCSTPLRLQALRAAKRVGAKRLRKQFHVTATELAFLRDQAIADRFVDAASAAEQDAAYQRDLQAQQLELSARAARRPSPDLPPPSAPQGWYADTWGQARMRWWDGRAWTGHVASPG